MNDWQVNSGVHVISFALWHGIIASDSMLISLTLMMCFGIPAFLSALFIPCLVIASFNSDVFLIIDVKNFYFI